MNLLKDVLTTLHLSRCVRCKQIMRAGEYFLDKYDKHNVCEKEVIRRMREKLCVCCRQSNKWHVV